MEALVGSKNVQKGLANCLRVYESSQIRGTLEEWEFERLNFLALKDTSLYWNNPDYGATRQLRGRYQTMTITDREYKYLFLRLQNVQHLCGRVFTRTGGVCRMGMDLRLTHAESGCRGTRGAHKNFSMQHALVSIAYELGIPVSTTGVILGTKLKGDLTIGRLDGKDLVVDVTNRTARQMACLDDRTKRDYSRHLDVAEDGKREKYTELCEKAGKQFAPFATSTWGAFGPGCNQVIGIFAARLQELEMITLGQAFTIIRRRIQSAFMKQIATNGLMELDKMDAKRQERIVFQERVLQLDGWAVQRAEFLEVQVFGPAEGDHDVLQLGGEFQIGPGVSLHGMI